MHTEHVARTPTNGSAVLLYRHMSPSVSHDQYTALPREFWSRHTDVYLTYIRFGKIWHSFCQFLETGTSDRCIIGIVQLLRFLGFSLYPFLFFLNSPFKIIEKSKLRRKYPLKQWAVYYSEILEYVTC